MTILYYIIFFQSRNLNQLWDGVIKMKTKKERKERLKRSIENRSSQQTTAENNKSHKYKHTKGQ